MVGLPPDAVLVEMIECGLTFDQIRRVCERRAGRTYLAATIVATLSRAWLEAARLTRLRDTVPWSVQRVHASEYAVSMLRLLGLRLSGLPLEPRSAQRLDDLLALLERERCLVGYSPAGDRGEGFLLVPELPGVRRHHDVPVQVRRVDYWDALDLRPVREPDSDARGRSA